MFPLEVEMYNLPLPNPGRWNFDTAGLKGRLILVKFPFTGTALYALIPASGSMTQRIPVPGCPLC